MCPRCNAQTFLLFMLKPSPPVPPSIPCPLLNTERWAVRLTPSSAPVRTSCLSPIGSAATQPRATSSGDDDPMVSRAASSPASDDAGMAGLGAAPRPLVMPTLSRRTPRPPSARLRANQGISDPWAVSPLSSHRVAVTKLQVDHLRPELKLLLPRTAPPTPIVNGTKRLFDGSKGADA
jgi:hypothetical protein